MKLTPLPGELAIDLEKRQAVEDCTTTYIEATAVMLTGNMTLARKNGSKSVFDLDAAHSEGVLNEVATRTGKPKGHAIANDVVAVLMLNKNGVAAGSPVPAGKMALIPSDPAAYVAAVAQLEAAFDAIAALGYAVVDLPQA